MRLVRNLSIRCLFVASSDCKEFQSRDTNVKNGFTARAHCQGEGHGYNPAVLALIYRPVKEGGRVDPGATNVWTGDKLASDHNTLDLTSRQRDGLWSASLAKLNPSLLQNHHFQYTVCRLAPLTLHITSKRLQGTTGKHIGVLFSELIRISTESSEVKQ